MITRAKTTKKDKNKEDLKEAIQKLRIQNVELTDKLESLQISLNSLLEENQDIKRENYESKNKISDFEKQSDAAQHLTQKNVFLENTLCQLKADIADFNLKTKKNAEISKENAERAEKAQNEVVVF